MTLVASLPALLWVPPVSAQVLEDALVQAYLTNPQLEAARANLRVTDELVPQALSGWRPNASVTGSVDQFDIDTDTGSDTLLTKGIGVDLEQPLYRGGETTASTRQAEAQVRSTRSSLLSTEQQVLLAAVDAYSQVIAARATLELAENNRERLARQLEATQDRFDVGEVTRTDVSQAQAALAEALADLVSAAGQVQSAEATYRQVVGRPPGALITPEPIRALPSTEAEAQAIAEGNNPDLVSAEYALDAALNGVDVARSVLRPRVSLNSSLDYVDDPSSQLDRQRTAQLGASVSVPLYQGGFEYSQVRETKQTVNLRRNEFDDIRRQVREEVTAAWESVVTTNALIRSLTEQVQANEVALDGVRQEALVGARTVLDTLDAEQDLFASQVDLVAAIRDRVIASYRLKAAVGELTAESLGLPVEPYDPENYYGRVRNNWFGLGEDVQQ